MHGLQRSVGVEHPAAPAARAAPAAQRVRLRRDYAALAGLLALGACFVAISWRKWPDPLIDYGRELYTPWRLSQGAVLYRDVDSYYGPLSQQVNALLFSVFGAGMMTLVYANLCVFAAIVALLFELCRRAWGRGAAFVGTAMFVSIFGFSQLITIGNYNFATPYSHEAVHGLLVCLALVAVLGRWTRAPTSANSALAGGLWGLTAVLKPEFMLAGAVITVGAVAWRWRRHGAFRVGYLPPWAAGAVAPSALFALFFARHVSWGEALGFAGRAWLNVLGKNATEFVGESLQSTFAGFDRPRENLIAELKATAIALAALAAVSGLARAVCLIRRPRIRSAASLVAACAIVVAGVRWIPWLEFGLALPGLIGVALIVVTLGGPPIGDSSCDALAMLLTLLSGALLARMALFARIFHYGFYQAAIALVVVVTVSLSEIPRRVTSDPGTRRTVFLAIALLASTGASVVATTSARLLASKTEAVGEGRDRFLCFRADREPTGPMVRRLVEDLRKYPSGDTLLVLPEGVMVNYLARRSSPVAPFSFFSSTTYGDGEARLVRELTGRPPDLVAIVDRDLSEYGIRRYGEAPGHGELILDWVGANYALEKRLVGDPLDPIGSSALLLRRRR